MTEAEERLWYFIRNRRLRNYKWVREQVIGNFIADFVCRSKKLIVELDGGQHTANVEYDTRRTEFLYRRGYRVLRIWNNDVFTDIDGVLQMILDTLEEVTN